MNERLIIALLIFAGATLAANKWLGEPLFTWLHALALAYIIYAYGVKEREAFND
jgi:hypothetical protein